MNCLELRLLHNELGIISQQKAEGGGAVTSDRLGMNFPM